MRGVMARWLGVAAVVAVACLIAVTAEEPRAVGEFVAVHRHFPRRTRVFAAGAVPEEKGIGFRGQQVVEPVERDGRRMQWNFNPFNPFQTFGVRREGHGHRKCRIAAKLRSWWPHLFRHHHDHEHEHHHDHEHEHHHHHDEEHRREHDHEHRFERTMKHHMHDHMHPPSLGRSLLRNIGRWFSGIPSFLSDVPALIRTWTARVGGRKPPTVESVTEPLDMHALRKPSSPSLLCSLREKLSRVFAAVSEEVATTGSTDNADTQSDVIKRNLKKFMGDSMQLRIVKSVCDTASMSSCEQEFCDVFLSHPKSGVLMAFRILGLNPVRAAINPKGVAAGLLTSQPLVRPELSKNERNMIINLRKTHRLAHIVFQRVLASNPTEESVPDFEHKLKNIFSKISGGELNPCKACLRQEIFRLKKLTKKSMIEVCENPVDSHLEQSCNFAKENRFVFKTLFAYKFKFWERAAIVCRDRKACDSPFTPFTDNNEQATNALVKGEELNSLHIAHFDVNSFRNPRGMEQPRFRPALLPGPNQWRGQKCGKRAALHTAAMLRGHSLDTIASELFKADESLSLQREHGPIIVVEFMARPQMEIGQEMHSIPLSFLHTMNMEMENIQNLQERFAGSVEFEPLREILKSPLVVSAPAQVEEVVEDAIAKPHDVLDSNVHELPSSVETSTEHPDM